jgi:creatinine amidohydrolase
MSGDTRLLSELTADEVAAHQERTQLVLVPVGSTEQHGPHSPLATDTLLAQAVCERVAERVDALVAPAIPFGISLEHQGFAGLIALTPRTMISLVGDVCISLSRSGFRTIVLVNGHYTNTMALSAAVLEASDRLEDGAIAYSLNYWDPLLPEQLERYLSLAAGLHANIGETSALMAVDESLVHLERAVAEYPAFPGAPSPAVIAAYFFSGRGTFHRASASGTWGDPRLSSRERGEEYLSQIEDAVARFIDEVERVFDQFGQRPK